MATDAGDGVRLGDGAPEVVAIAPLRIDLTGGFTDIPPFSSTVESLHINATIDLSVSVRCRRTCGGQFSVNFTSERNQTASGSSEGRRRFVDAIRRSVTEFVVGDGVELSIGSEAPAGSGLGSSGAILVAAIQGCAKLAGASLTPAAVARRAIAAAAAAGILGGQQDEFAAAHGSLRAYVFATGNTVRIREFTRVAAARELEQSLLVVQLEAGGRKADVVGEVVTAVRMRDRSTLGALWRLQDLAHELFEAIDRASLDRLPRCMRSIREAQAALHAAVCCPVTAAALEAVRRKLPELEYKILGGGGAGSCVLIHIPPGDRLRAIELLEKYATRVLPVRIQSHGVRAEHLASLAASLS